ncbi:hypothetical protein FMUND_15753 [Fusarium mundagurra]|uniref:Transcription factor domain-containing protein n=1 Tax=Fusarium mundagurra TaxID=1567541 RepID=A0A8H5XMP3_9HYPO|nr:hypothetical protein FMUND_15753 [Fusarium mundagurra]
MGVSLANQRGISQKSLNTRIPSFSSTSSTEDHPDLDGRTFSDSSSHLKVEQEPWSSFTLTDGIGDVGISSWQDWKTLGEDFGDILVESLATGHSETTGVVDIGPLEQDLEIYTPWAVDESHWLNDCGSLDTFSNFNMDSCKGLTPIASPVDLPSPSHYEETFILEAQDQRQISTTPSHESQEEASQPISQTTMTLYNASVPQTLTHTPTFLIDYWFQTVCATWNSFDSAKNLNRSVALEAFSYSEGLAYSLQSMAAAYLAEYLPHFRGIAISTTLAAVQAIKRELTKTLSPHVLPRHLLLSMFCIGTSACWTDPLQFGLPFLKETKAILRSYNQSKHFLSKDDQDALLFFNKSTMYWDMLCSIIDVQDTDITDPPTTSSPMTSQPGSSQGSLHPWTGVSTEIMELFFHSILLCKGFRARMTRGHRQSSRSLQAALRYIEEARELHQCLKSFPIPVEQEICETGDIWTPKSQLVQIAEAYRLAAMAHLYQTFSDLRNQDISLNGNNPVDTEYQVLELGLKIIRILEKIPLASGTRCIQPLLCLTAGILMKFNVPVIDPPPHTPRLLNDVLSADLRSAPNTALPDPLFADIHHNTRLSPGTTKRCIEVGQGRRFVLERLSLLESSLPPKPIRVVKQLVQTVWAAYDGQGAGGGSLVHWIDIMAQLAMLVWPNGSTMKCKSGIRSLDFTYDAILSIMCRAFVRARSRLLKLDPSTLSKAVHAVNGHGSTGFRISDGSIGTATTMLKSVTLTVAEILGDLEATLPEYQLCQTRVHIRPDLICSWILQISSDLSWICTGCLISAA